MITKTLLIILMSFFFFGLAFSTQHIAMTEFGYSDPFEDQSDYFDDSNTIFAQSFQVTNNQQNLDNITISLWRANGGDTIGNIRVNVHELDLAGAGDPKSDIICEGTSALAVVDIFEEYFTDNRYTFNFSNCVLNAGNYVLEVYSNGVSPYNVGINNKLNSPYTDGDKFYSNNLGSTWTKQTNFDLLFEIYLSDYIAPDNSPCSDYTLFNWGNRYQLYNSTQDVYLLAINGNNTWYLNDTNNKLDFTINDLYFDYFRDLYSMGVVYQYYGVCMDFDGISGSSEVFNYNSGGGIMDFPYHVSTIWKNAFNISGTFSWIMDSINYNYNAHPNMSLYFYTLHQDGYADKILFIKRKMVMTHRNIDIYGCMDSQATNYNPQANIDDGSCTYAVHGCTHANALNYNPLATIDDGTCISKVYGCIDSHATNYNPQANIDDDSCTYSTFGCTNKRANNYDAQALHDDGSCVFPSISVTQLGNGETILKGMGSDFGSFYAILGYWSQPLMAIGLILGILAVGTIVVLVGRMLSK